MAPTYAQLLKKPSGTKRTAGIFKVYMKARSYPFLRAPAFIPSLSRYAGMVIIQNGFNMRPDSFSCRPSEDFYKKYKFMSTLFCLHSVDSHRKSEPGMMRKNRIKKEIDRPKMGETLSFFTKKLFFFLPGKL